MSHVCDKRSGSWHCSERAASYCGGMQSLSRPRVRHASLVSCADPRETPALAPPPAVELSANQDDVPTRRLGRGSTVRGVVEIVALNAYDPRRES